MVAAQLEGFGVAVDDHDAARDVAVCRLSAVNLDDEVAVLAVAFDQPAMSR